MNFFWDVVFPENYGKGMFLSVIFLPMVMYSVTDAVDIVCTPKTLFAQVDYLQSQCKVEVCIFKTEADAISILMHSLRYIWSNYLCDTIHPYYIAVRSDFDLIQHYGSK